MYKKDLIIKWEHMAITRWECVWKNNFESKLNKNAKGNAVVIVNASDG